MTLGPPGERGQRAARGGARIGVHPTLFNATCLLAGLTLGCRSDPPPVEVHPDGGKVVTADASPKPADAALPPLPKPIEALVMDLPAPAVASPGQGAGAVLSRPEIQPSPYTSSIRVHQLGEEGPFVRVLYQLDPAETQVVGVLYTVNPLYRQGTRRSELESELTARYGKGRALTTSQHEGLAFSLPDYHLELRQDRKTQDLELLFHRRGATPP